MEGCQEFSIPGGSEGPGQPLPAIECAWGQTNSSEPPLPVIVFGGNSMAMYRSAAYMRNILPRNISWTVYSMSMSGFQYAPRRSYWSRQEDALADAKTLMAYVENVTGHSAVVIFGMSLGSSLAAGLAAGSKPEDVRCLMLLDPFTSMYDEFEWYSWHTAWPFLFLLDEWPTKAWARMLKVPTIVMNSLRDKIVPAWMHEEVYEAVRSPLKELVSEDTAHVNITAFVSSVRSRLEDWCIHRKELSTTDSHDVGRAAQTAASDLLQRPKPRPELRPKAERRARARAARARMRGVVRRKE